MVYLKKPLPFIVPILLAFVYLGCQLDILPSNRLPEESTPQKAAQNDQLLDSELPIFLDGASISQGLTASFSIEHRLMAHFNQYSNAKRELLRRLWPRTVYVLLDDFFATDFPYWGNISDGIRAKEVTKRLKNMLENYDVILYTELPNEAMLYQNSSKSVEEWEQLLRAPNLRFIRNMFGEYPLARVENPRPKLVRDEINRTLQGFVRNYPNRFIRMPVDSFFQEAVATEKLVDFEGRSHRISELFSDDIHLNDLGQTLLINKTILPAIESTAFVDSIHQSPSTPVYFPRISALGVGSEDWKEQVKQFVYSSGDRFDQGVPGNYLLSAVDQRAFFGSRGFIPGMDATRNPLLSKVRLANLFTFTESFFSQLPLEIPLRISTSGNLSMDLRKPLHGPKLPVSVNRRMKNGLLVLEGFGRDYWLSASGFKTNYRIQLEQIEAEKFRLTWFITPLTTAQGKMRERRELSQKEIEALLKDWENLHKLKLEGEFELTD